MSKAWTQQPTVRNALRRGVQLVKGYCDTYDVDTLIGALMEHGLMVVLEPAEPDVEEDEWSVWGTDESEGCSFCGQEGHKQSDCPNRP